jgi:hypothetical protein
MDGYLSKSQMEGLIARRDLLVRLFEGQIAKRGENAVLYDYLAPRSSAEEAVLAR